MNNPLLSFPFNVKKTRGRPKQIKDDGPTPELIKKRKRIRDILRQDAAPLLSWLHIAYQDGTLNQDLFDLGKAYLRFRIQVLRHQQAKTFKLNCNTFRLSRGSRYSPLQDYKDAKAEERWQDLCHVFPTSILSYLDKLLLENVGYHLTAQEISVQKKRLRKALLFLQPYQDFL